MKVLTYFLLALPLFFSVAEAQSYRTNPIVYGISPAYIANGQNIKGLVAIRRRLQEIKNLGANIVWLQPITVPFEEDGHGYDVIDYGRVWEHLGSHQDLKLLVREAHSLGIGVMLDVVLNHSSEMHPWVLDVKAKGQASPYFEIYQHEPITNVPYAQHFNDKKIGNTNFIHYFWGHLLNFNYNSPLLRSFIINHLKSWVLEFGVDGFRFDASWGPSSRFPYFYSWISSELRKVHPGIILMAEDMAGYPVAYRGSRHPHLRGSSFNWAYDWDNTDPHYISKWSFQLEGDNFESTVFNLEDPTEAASAFVKALSPTLNTQEIRPVRYLENNDTPGFRLHHSLEQAVWAAKVYMLLPGVPLIFYGQETGNSHEIYELPSFDPAKTLHSRNPQLWALYQRLTRIRLANPDLHAGKITNLVAKGEEVVLIIQGTKANVLHLHFGRKEVVLNGQKIL